MRKYSSHFVLILLIAIAGPAFASTIFFSAGIVQEKVFLFTDRSIYIAGEQIQFSASIFNSESQNSPELSRILYCELVTPDGIIVSNNKFIINQTSADGCILIPKEQVTGTYYVRAYTKLMREYGPYSYEYKQIKIINPKSADVMETGNTSGSPNGEITFSQAKVLNDILSVSIDKTVCKSRDTISIVYHKVNTSAKNINCMSLSVVPDNSISSESFDQQSKIKLQKVETGYYPETRGLSLTGKLTEVSSLLPVPDKRINLSIIGEGRDFMVTRTDSLGRFFFALPNYQGSRDLFLCTEKMPAAKVKIWVDNDFCTTPFRLPSPKFSLTDQERITARNMSQNVQISSHFRKTQLTESVSTQSEVYSFYGKPTTVLYLDKYIMLPTLEEYFNELPSQVKVRKRKGESYFVVQGNQELSFYDPLVLVDWVAVDEPAKILAIPPINVSRIEVVNEDYVKGGQTYGGVISIISKKGDFAGVDLPSTGIFINYRFLSETRCLEVTDNISATIPDARNTVVWKPSLKQADIDIKTVEPSPSQLFKPAQKEQKIQVERIIFTAPDTPGKYVVLFEGVTTNGELFSVKSVFEVKN